MIQKPKKKPKYEFKSLEILEQACALARIEDDGEKASMAMKYHYTQEYRFEKYKIELPPVEEQDKVKAQVILDYFRKFMFFALSDNLTSFQGILYDALYTDVIYYQQLKALSLAPFIYEKDIKNDVADDILRRTSGKLFSKADSPITRTVQVLSVDCVKTRDNDTFWAYTAITDDDYFVKFNQSTQICNPMDVITIKGSFRETDIEYRTKLPVTKLFRVKQL